MPSPTCEVTIDGCLEGIAYEAVVAAMNSEGWGDVSPASEPACIGEPKPRGKPPAPTFVSLICSAKGKLKCTWVLPDDACPPVEASQVRLTDVAKGVSQLVDAAKGNLVESGRTTFAAPRVEATISGVEDGVEYIAAVCCRNAEGFGDYSYPSDPALSGIASLAANGQSTALVLHSGPSDEVPSLVPQPVGEGRMKVSWKLPMDAKSTMVKLRRVGEKSWHLVGGTAIPKPACETFATGLEEGIEYEACVSFLNIGRWGKDSKPSRPACIGEVKLPGTPGAAKEPVLFVIEDGAKMRCRWRLPTTVPPVSAVIVKVRAVGGREWFYVPPKTGMPQAEEGEPVVPPTAQVDIVGLHPGVRYEACIALRNKMGLGPDSIPSEAACIGRPTPRIMKCMYCYNDFDLQHASYTKAPENFWCPGCRFRNMDPFNAVVEPSGLLVCQLVTRPVMSFSLDLPDLKAWRKEEHTVQMRMVRIDSDNCAQVWPMTVTVEANTNEVFKIIPPEEGHVRRDVPRSIAGGVKPGSNAFTVTVDDTHVAGFAMALVHTYPRTVQQIAADIAVISEEAGRERVCGLLSDNWSDDRIEGAIEEEDSDAEISCVISNKLKLRCPLSFERVVIPVRGEACAHLQCFGLGAYLESNVKMRALNNRWTCPVCTTPLRPRDLRIDGYVEKVLTDTPEYVDEVAILPGGAWKVVEDDAQALERRKNELAKQEKAPAIDGVDEDLEAKVLPTEIDDDRGPAKRKAVSDISAAIKNSNLDAAQQPLLTRRQLKRQRLLTVEEGGENSPEGE